MGKEEEDAVVKVIRSGNLSGFIASAGDAFWGGPKVLELEGMFENRFDSEFAIAMNSATSALHAAVAALGIGTGDEVITTPYTMSATAAAILMQNAKPVFADINPDNFGLDAESVAQKITPCTKAILVVHLFGFPANIQPLLDLAKKHALKVIEDCAQAPDAHIQSKPVGTWGDIGVFSLNQHKVITSGEGGMAITQNPILSKRMQLIRNHGETIESEHLEGDKPILGWNYRMTELEAAVAVEQVKRLSFLTTWRQKLASVLSVGLKDVPSLKTPRVLKGNASAYFSYPIRFCNQTMGIKRETFAKALRAEGINCGTGYVEPLYRRRIYDNLYPDGVEPCVVTEKFYHDELLLLPNCRWPNTEADMDDVIKAIHKVYLNRNALADFEKLDQVE